MLFNCEPDCADILKPLLYEELEDINKHGPKEEDLDKVLTNICKDKKQTKPHNL
jgi:zinc protease